MSIIAWIVLGLLAGWIAGLIMSGGGYGILSNIVIGIAGALIGGWLGATFLGIAVTGLNLTSLILAVVGAIILIVIFRAIGGARRPVV